MLFLILLNSRCLLFLTATSYTYQMLCQKEQKNIYDYLSVYR